MLRLANLTGDPLYEQMAGEMISYIGNSQIDAPGKPWHGALIHAFTQNIGKYWGADFEGQVDCGMSNGIGLAALEAWLAHEKASR
jgi:hypothetical protein